MSDDLYVKKDDDKPFDAVDKKFLSMGKMFQFIIVGLPRIIMMIVLYIIAFIFSMTIKDNNSKYSKFIVKICSRLKLYLFGYKNINISKETKEIVKKSDAQIIICNHASYLDIGFVMQLLPDVKMITSEFVKKIPIVSHFFKHKAIYLKSEFGGNMTSVIEDELKKGSRILFFSEGVCCLPKLFLKLRNGAFVPRLKILPLHIDYDEENCWVMGQNDMFQHAMVQISNKNNKATIRAIEEYIPTEEEKSGDIEIFKENFRKYYAKGFDVKLSNLGYKDHPYYKLKIKDSEKN